MNRNTFKIVLILLSLVVTIAAQLQAAEDSGTGDSFAAKVNSREISRSDFDNAVKIARQQFAGIGAGQKSESDTVNIEKEVLDRLIDFELMLQDAQQRKIEVDSMAVDVQMGAFRNQFKTETEFTDYLQKNSITTDTIARQIEKQITLQKLQGQLLEELRQGVEVTQKESKAFYEANREKFTHPEQVRASHILIKIDKESAEGADEQALAIIKDIREKAVSGEDFAELAQKNSQGPSSTSGGDLGSFAKGQMVPAFEKAAFALDPGEISKVVTTQFGYHIIKVSEKISAGTTPFEDVEGKIGGYLTQIQLEKAQADYTSKLRNEAKIVLNI